MASHDRNRTCDERERALKRHKRQANVRPQTEAERHDTELHVLMKTRKLPYMLPHRLLAIEAMIAAVIMRDPMQQVEANILVICHEVEHALSWALRTEIHRAVQRMVRQGRIIPKPHPTRAIPLYALAGCTDASHDASPSPA